MARPLISIVTPCFNEEPNIFPHFQAVGQFLSPFREKYEFEHIYTDNCSHDRTWDRLKELSSQHSNIRLMKFSRNLGANRAIYMGLIHARGDAAILIQADLQDPPDLIPQFIRGWEEGYDVVYGSIQNRAEGWFLRNLRKFYYSSIAGMADVAPPKNAGEFRLTSRRVLEAIKQYTEDDLYLRGAIAHIGFKQKPIPYHRMPRTRGRTSTSLPFLMGYAINGLISTSTVAPIRAVTLFGVLISFLGFGVGAYTIAAKLLWAHNIPHGITMVIALVSFLAGAQLFALGVIGEYIRKIYIQSLRRPLGFIEERINF